MTRIGKGLAIAGCALAFTTTAACGSSHNESTASVCSKLDADTQSLTGSANSNDPKVVAATFKTAASKFKADASKAKDSSLRTNVNKVSDSLNSFADQILAGKTPDEQAFENQVGGAINAVKADCPNIGGG